MDVTGWFVLVPLALASFGTGVVQAVGTTWGLLRHYWVLFKLLINLFAIVVLLLYTQELGHLARIAAETPATADLAALRTPSVVLHAGAALVLLLVATTLSIYKPQGRTPFRLGRNERSSAAQL